jgi:hypothetical protein
MRFQPALLLNSFQTLSAVRDFFDTALLTRSATNAEFESFGSYRWHQTSLRVSQRTTDSQRSTYLLQLSFPAAILFQAVITLYNWGLSAIAFEDITTLTWLGDQSFLPVPFYTVTTNTNNVSIGFAITAWSCFNLTPHFAEVCITYT